MLGTVFSSSSLTPNIKWSGLSVMVHGISIIIYYSYVGGQRGYQSTIFRSPIPHSGFRYGVSHLKACLNRLVGTWVIVWGNISSQTRDLGFQSKPNS